MPSERSSTISLGDGAVGAGTGAIEPSSLTTTPGCFTTITIGLHTIPTGRGRCPTIIGRVTAEIGVIVRRIIVRPMEAARPIIDHRQRAGRLTIDRHLIGHPITGRPPLLCLRRMRVQRGPQRRITGRPTKTQTGRQTKLGPFRQPDRCLLLDRRRLPRIPTPAISRTKAEALDLPRHQTATVARSAATTAVAKLKQRAAADSKA